MKLSRRKLSPEFEAKVEMAAMKGDRTLSELSLQFDVHLNQIMTRKKKLMENAIALFSGNPRERGETGAEIKELHAKIGQQVDMLANGRYAESYHNLTFDASNLSSGIYFIRATVSGKMNQLRKVVLTK